MQYEQGALFRVSRFENKHVNDAEQQWIRTWRNPFATASWVHLIITSCQPFDVRQNYLSCSHIVKRHEIGW